MSDHPTKLDLELLRTGEADEDIARHVEACTTCRARLGALDKLARDIALPSEPPVVPDELDAALAAMARQRGDIVRRELQRTRWPGRRAAWRVVPWAAAAGVALVLGVLFALRASRDLAPAEPPRPGIRPVVAAAGPDDVNADGRVDVIDAYLVARAAERGEAPGTWDRNGDGRVDRLDADRITAAAVALGEEGAR